MTADRIHQFFSTFSCTWNSSLSFLSIHSVTWQKVTSLSPSFGRTCRSNLGGTEKLYLKRDDDGVSLSQQSLFLTLLSFQLRSTLIYWMHTLMSMQRVNNVDNWCCSPFSPYSVCWWWWHIDDQGPWQLLHLHSEQQRRVGHLLKLLFDELILCCLLEIFGFCDFVHKSQNLLSSLRSPRPVKTGLVGETEGWESVMPEALVFRCWSQNLW